MFKLKSANRSCLCCGAEVYVVKHKTNPSLYCIDCKVERHRIRNIVTVYILNNFPDFSSGRCKICGDQASRWGITQETFRLLYNAERQRKLRIHLIVPICVACPVIPQSLYETDSLV